MTTDEIRIRERDKLNPKNRAVSDALDEYLVRIHGLYTSWTHPIEFIEWLEERGYTVTVKELDHGN